MEMLRRTSRTTLAIATAVLIFVALLFAYVLDITSNEDGEGDAVGWLIVSAVASVIAAALLLRFVPATESEADDENKPARRGLVLAIVALLTGLVFWTGLPFALGVPALVLAAEGQARAGQYGHRSEATAAAVIAGFAIVASFVVCITG
jgi:Kef-type K+ transport system membrane component KefB